MLLLFWQLAVPTQVSSFVGRCMVVVAGCSLREKPCKQDSTHTQKLAKDSRCSRVSYGKKQVFAWGAEAAAGAGTARF